MPTASNGDVSLYYATDGSGKTVVFVSEAGLGGWLWGWQHAAMAGPYETVVWDLRGTGRSDRPPGPYSLETLAEDLEAVLADCGTRSAHVVGAGLGGAIALTAARRSTRVETLTLFGTAPEAADFELEPLLADPDDRAALEESTEAVFSAGFRRSQPAVIDGIVDWRAEGDGPLEAARDQLAALEGFDATDWLVDVTRPTLVCHGTEDELVAPAAGRRLGNGLPRGEYVPIDGAGHWCFIEHSRTVNDRLLGFFEEHDEQD